MTLGEIANLALAAFAGGAIGLERQWNQGLAGLRTNTLVAFGAACFCALHDQAVAYVVTGIGFLGAGVIFREGTSVRGLNTAATLWCSGAVGALSGAGNYTAAMLGTAGVVAINLGMLPLQQAINRHRPHPVDNETDYLIEIDCAAEAEPNIRAVLSGATAQAGLGLRSLNSQKLDGRSGNVQIAADFVSHFRIDEAVERLVVRIGLDNEVSSARWSIPNLVRPRAANIDN